MSKRKHIQADDDSDDSSENLIDVDFDFFDPNPDVDFQAVKRLIGQLFSADAELLHPHDLAELILSQPQVGSTVKTDGKESDPYAVLTVLNLHVHQNNPAIKSLVEYALLKSQPDAAFHSALHSLIGPAALGSSNHVGYVFSERLINMPVQVMPHMYRMLVDELRAAVEQNQPFKYGHLLLISRTYRLSSEEEAALNAQPFPSQSKKRRAQTQVQPTSASGIYSFHHEDMVIQKFASHVLDFSFSNSQPREQDAFGLDLSARMMLVSADKLPELVVAMSEAFLTSP
ncbi:p21-C-terminal region-binding protein-domain-containing protein [Vararia minispora EC-137]|uniref:P21-C-terminal region-binding protein-domain-containing protein n=1 Tax=Vararia minispora EC-137 TaxID=1314806 RepID=A0ACB8QTT7_9AGAM|nr:p21-C-terminal region-binding protein-domain-containing protein [Vararia minispora EC-137]